MSRHVSKFAAESMVGNTALFQLIGVTLRQFKIFLLSTLNTSCFRPFVPLLLFHFYNALYMNSGDANTGTNTE